VILFLFFSSTKEIMLVSYFTRISILTLNILFIGCSLGNTKLVIVLFVFFFSISHIKCKRIVNKSINREKLKSMQNFYLFLCLLAYISNL